MAKTPDFARLHGVLNTSKLQQTNNAAYQVITQLINALEQQQESIDEKLSSIPATTPTPPPSGSGDVTGPSSSVDSNVVLFSGITGKVIKDSGIPIGQVVLSTDPRLSDARTPTAHAPSHSQGGSDPITITNLAGFNGNAAYFLNGNKVFSIPIITSLGGFPGGTANFLRSDGVFAAPPINGGVPAAHHTTHETGGSDAIAALSGAVITSGTVLAARLPAITSLGGFPGGTTAYLRADGSFATPTAGVPGAHATTHYNGASDPVDVKQLAGFDGSTVNYLRGDRTFNQPDITQLQGFSLNANQILRGDKTFGALPAAALPAHAGTHISNGSDPVNITLLAGFAGDINYSLRGDRSFRNRTAFPAPVPIYGDYVQGWQNSTQTDVNFDLRDVHGLILREFGTMPQIELNTSQVIYPGSYYYVIGAPITLTLPDSATYVGQIISIDFGLQMGSNMCTLHYGGPNGIDGLADRKFMQREHIILRAGPYHWHRIGGSSLHLNAKMVSSSQQGCPPSGAIWFNNWNTYLDNLGTQSQPASSAIGCRRTGTYRITAMCRAVFSNASYYNMCDARVNGNTAYVWAQIPTPAGGGYLQMVATGMQFMNDGDYVQLLIQQNSPDTVNFDASLEIQEVNPYR